MNWLLFLLFFAPAPAPPPAAVKMERVAQQLAAAQKRPQKVRFSFTESELNQYVAYDLATQQRPGLQRILLHVAPENDVAIDIQIDLDDVARWRPDLIPPLLRAVLHGPQTIQMQARFEAERGGLTFTVEKASLDGFPLPPALVQKILVEVASHQPEHYDLTRPVRLPNGVQRVWTTEDRQVAGEN